MGQNPRWDHGASAEGAEISRAWFRLDDEMLNPQCRVMLRPAKKYSVYDLRQLKGKMCLTHVHVKSPEEAAAAEAAGIDLLSCSFDSPASQARLPLLVEAAPRSFISGATPHGMALAEEAIRIGFRALELGASSVYCSASPTMIEAMAREGIPVVGHLGMVPRHATWTNIRAIGKTSAEACELYLQMKRLEAAGAYAAELELVPHQLASFLCKNTSMILMSLGSGNGCDTQFLFSDDILGDYDERIPRHAKAYRNFRKEFQRLQAERVAAFKEYAADVAGGGFPGANNLISMDPAQFAEAVEAIERSKSSLK
jgi:3-methyl-2-oxobutanoate hydroxymethyltransferase